MKAFLKILFFPLAFMSMLVFLLSLIMTIVYSLFVDGLIVTRLRMKWWVAVIDIVSEGLMKGDINPKI